MSYGDICDRDHLETEREWINIGGNSSDNPAFFELAQPIVDRRLREIERFETDVEVVLDLLDDRDISLV